MADPVSSQGGSQPRKKLARRLIGLVFFSSLALTLLVGLVSFVLLKEQLTQSRDRQLQSEVNLLNSALLGFLERGREQMTLMANDRAIEKYTVSYNELALGQLFEQFNDVFAEIIFADANGIAEVIYTAKDGMQNLNRDISTSQLFIKASQQPNTAVLGNKSEAGETTRGMYLGYFVVDYFGQKHGYVQVRLSSTLLRKSLNAFPMPEHFIRVVTDPDGEVVYTSRSNLTGSVIDSIVMQGYHDQSQGVVRVNFLDCSACYVNAERIAETQWSGLSVVSAVVFDEVLRRLVLNTLLLYGLITAVIMVIAGFVALRLTRPIKILSEATYEIAHTEQLDRRVDWESDDETGELASNFNLMLEKLEQSHNRAVEAQLNTENIINSIADPVVVADVTGKITQYNPATTRLLGYREDELLNQQAGTCFASDQEQARASIANTLEKGIAVDGLDTVLVSKSGEHIHVSLSASVLKDVHGDQMGIVYVAKDISSLKQVEKHLHYLANHDNLTGLPNRLLFLDRLAQSLAANSRDNTSSAVLFLDLDRFKAVNDTLGHEAGDVLLKHVAERLSSSVRKSDTVARLGGDEFVVLLNHIKDEKYVDELAEKILAELRRPIDLMGNSYIATTSIGVSISPRDGEEPDQVLKKADMAMYEAKRRGKNTYCIFSSEMEEIQETTFHAEHALRTADIEREFVVYYQPIVSAESQDIIGTEALVRWHRDDGEIVQPGGFLNMAEDTGMIIPIGAHVLRQACIQTRAWQKQGLGELMVSVNISDRQFHHSELITDIEVALKDSGLAPGDLHLELTEGVLMFNTERAPGVIQAMKDMGCHISVDDFGTGYSSLSHLQKIALDTIKIDRSFVHELPGNRNDATICEAIISLAQKLNLNIVAEGVETREHVDFLTNMGASSLQGYFYGKPMLAEELEKLLRNEI